jgi:DNA-binding FadR family transcriptional regulator
VKVARLHLKLLRLLVAEIAQGSRVTGERLPSETDLAKEFSVSRSVVRETIRGLEERGLVQVRRRQGTVVAPGRSWNLLDPDVLEALLAGPFAFDVLAEFVECRRILEIEAAGLAAERATPDDLLRLAGAITQMKASSARRTTAASEEVFNEADIDFHNAILTAANNRILLLLTQPIARALVAVRRPLAQPQLRDERGIPEHMRILTAIAKRDAQEARAAMGAHLDTVARTLEEARQDETRTGRG